MEFENTDEILDKGYISEDESILRDIQDEYEYISNQEEDIKTMEYNALRDKLIEKYPGVEEYRIDQLMREVFGDII